MANTRTRILIECLGLFNEKGESATTTNEIALAADISPGNLHYHFKRKSELVDELFANFVADSQPIVGTSTVSRLTLPDFWLFVHLVLELVDCYRFLFRDIESLTERHPQTRRRLGEFVCRLESQVECFLRMLQESEDLNVDTSSLSDLAHVFVVVILMTDRLDGLARRSGDHKSLSRQGPRSVLSVLRQAVPEESKAWIDEVLSTYQAPGRRAASSDPSLALQ